MPSTRNKVQPQNISHEHELDSKGVYQLANGAWAYRFCKSVNGMKADDRHFRITVPIAVSPQFYGWVFGLKNMVTIESPQSVVDGMKEMLAAVEKRYEDSKGSQ